jgi:hypothetical protein
MSDVRERLEAHRNDASVLLEQVSRTARTHEGFRLAGAVGHLARAQVLLTEELFGLPEGSKPEDGSSGGCALQPADRGDDTPLDGIRLVTPRPGESSR